MEPDLKPITETLSEIMAWLDPSGIEARITECVRCLSDAGERALDPAPVEIHTETQDEVDKR